MVEDSLRSDLGYLIVEARRSDSSHPVWGVSVTASRVQREDSEPLELHRQANEESMVSGSTNSDGKLVIGPIVPGEWAISD